MSLHLYQRASHRIGNSRNDEGFTVLEVVVAVAIFVTVGAAAGTAVVGGIRSTTTTDNRIGGSNIAQSDLEQARAQSTPSPTSYATTPPNGTGSYQVTRTVTMPTPSAGANCPAGREIGISVVVTGPGSATTRYQMSTVIAC